mmetsp:Transcript_115087/g.371958  ORF Transcript_115087/g.371958 Transcript_115087/m.371958 type:complete len:404 (-) Transcript_115087:561-1772(-)
MGNAWSHAVGHGQAGGHASGRGDELTILGALQSVRCIAANDARECVAREALVAHLVVVDLLGRLGAAHNASVLHVRERAATHRSAFLALGELARGLADGGEVREAPGGAVDGEALQALVVGDVVVDKLPGDRLRVGDLGRAAAPHGQALLRRVPVEVAAGDAGDGEALVPLRVAVVAEALGALVDGRVRVDDLLLRLRGRLDGGRHAAVLRRAGGHAEPLAVEHLAELPLPRADERVAGRVLVVPGLALDAALLAELRVAALALLAILHCWGHAAVEGLARVLHLLERGLGVLVYLLRVNHELLHLLPHRVHVGGGQHFLPQALGLAQQGRRGLLHLVRVGVHLPVELDRLLLRVDLVLQLRSLTPARAILGCAGRGQRGLGIGDLCLRLLVALLHPLVHLPH